ncbi:MAG TPA: response regulator [Beijerinckiaceae bacterium]|nr:response regulator [Beijerinckiaceae bacterium]
MHTPPLVLAVDDTPENLEILRMRLEAQGYAVAEAVDGEDGLAKARALRPDLILLDIMMPKRDGISVVRELKQDPELRAIPVILVTAKADTRDVVQGLDAGGDDYLTKPFEHSALLARVRSMLRQKALSDTVQAQTRELAEWNTALEERVAAQVGEIERIGRLRRFLSPQIAEAVVSSDGGESVLRSHRRDVTVMFCDLRGFTAFAETAEPEEVMAVLGEYHTCLGALIFQYGGTLERFLGDGLLVVMNDPVPCPDHPAQAVRMALEMRDCMRVLETKWRKQGHELGFGIGIARGYATLGQIGFEGRLEYSVIGTVPNLAARLCGEAAAGQILVSQRVFTTLEDELDATLVGELALKGFHRPMPAYEVRGWRQSVHPSPSGEERVAGRPAWGHAGPEYGASRHEPTLPSPEGEG